MCQCDQIWRNFATWANVYEQVFGSLYLIWAKCWAYVGKRFDIIGLIFINANGQILKNNLTVWSHWLQLTELTKKFFIEVEWWKPKICNTYQNSRITQKTCFKCIFIEATRGSIPDSVKLMKMERTEQKITKNLLDCADVRVSCQLQRRYFLAWSSLDVFLLPSSHG